MCVAIKHDNIFYVRNIHAIGGVETFVYELAKKYKDYDIAVVCKDIALEQKARLNKYCKVYVHKDEPIECKVIITNWDTSIYDYVNDDAKKYTVLHTDYSNTTEMAGLPKDRPDITYIGITDYSKKAFEKITGIDRTILCRNPLELEEDENILTLISATRLTEIKDNGRHLKLAQSLERQGIPFVWYIFTTDEYNNNPIWKDPNIIHVKNRLDLGNFIKKADWYVQLSICEGDSYSLKEALYRGTPIVVCELPYFKEIGIENNVNALFYNSDNSNADDVALRMKEPLKFTFKHIEDSYDKILSKSKSHYEEDKKMKAKVRCIFEPFYDDVELGERKYKGDEYVVSEDRAEYLRKRNAVEILEVFKDEPLKTETQPFGEPVFKEEDIIKDIAKKELEKTFNEIGNVINKDIKVVETKPKQTKKKK